MEKTLSVPKKVLEILSEKHLLVLRDGDGGIVTNDGNICTVTNNKDVCTVNNNRGTCAVINNSGSAGCSVINKANKCDLLLIPTVCAGVLDTQDCNLVLRPSN